MRNILWIAPNLNHYKARFLNRLAESKQLKLTILAGAKMGELGHRTYKEKENFVRIDLNATKKNFHVRPAVYITLLQLLYGKRFDVVLMPVEKKHITLILFLFLLKFLLRYKLISYNHPMTVSKNRKRVALEKIVSKILFALYDRIIFYTKQGRQWAVEQSIVPPSKAFFANNTLDTKQIWANYSFGINTSESKTILFIGRLIPNKKIDILLSYYHFLKDKLPQLKLIVIGDGPESYKAKNAAQSDASISWRGAVVDEHVIAKDMRQAHIVFVPGHSGLSIVHAFCYGKPYMTIFDEGHPPEIDYLQDGINGLLLSGRIEHDSDRIVSLLQDKQDYTETCQAAFATAQELSIENWCQQMQQALTA